MKIHQLPGTKLSPETVLSQALEIVRNGGESVMIVVLSPDGTDVMWSHMPKERLAFCSMVIQAEVVRQLNCDCDS